jgi:hypothetical protein
MALWVKLYKVVGKDKDRRYVAIALERRAVAAFGSAFDQPLVWIFWLPCVVSVFWRIQRAPAC